MVRVPPTLSLRSASRCRSWPRAASSRSAGSKFLRNPKLLTEKRTRTSALWSGGFGRRTRIRMRLELRLQHEDLVVGHAVLAKQTRRSRRTLEHGHDQHVVTDGGLFGNR